MDGNLQFKILSSHNETCELFRDPGYGADFMDFIESTRNSALCSHSHALHRQSRYVLANPLILEMVFFFSYWIYFFLISAVQIDKHWAYASPSEFARPSVQWAQWMRARKTESRDETDINYMKLAYSNQQH